MQFVKHLHLFDAVFLFSEIAALKVAVTVFVVLVADLWADYACFLVRFLLGFLTRLEGEVVVGSLDTGGRVFLGFRGGDVELRALYRRLASIWGWLFRGQLDQRWLWLARHREVLEDLVQVFRPLFELCLAQIQLLLLPLHILPELLLTFLYFEL